MKKVSSSSCSSGSSGGGGALRGHWKPCEDMKLQELVSLYGPQNWNLIAQKLQGRSGKSCRLRWFNQLDPRINRRPFSGEEEARLMAAQAAYGNRWAAIARLFPGRTDNSLKNHWHVITARRSRRSRDAPSAPLAAQSVPSAPLAASSSSSSSADRLQAQEDRFRWSREGGESMPAVDGHDDDGESNGGGDSGGSCSSRSTCCNSFNDETAAETASETAPEGGRNGGATATRWLLGAVDRGGDPTAQIQPPPSPLFIDFLGVERQQEEEEEEEKKKKKKLFTCNFFSL